MRPTGKEKGDGTEIAVHALRECEERLKSLIAVSVDWYWEQDESHRVVLIEGGGLNLLGIDPQLLVGKALWDEGGGVPGAPRPRYLAAALRADLVRKMAFVAGPRQVGKTTLALGLPRARAAYLNWDVAPHRDRMLRGELPPGPLWIFDEIHKYRRWRNYLKGLYDGRPPGQRILVTGSGRLDLYRFGGDSLQGRYHLLRLHPFSAAELGLSRPAQLLADQGGRYLPQGLIQRSAGKRPKSASVENRM